MTGLLSNAVYIGHWAVNDVIVIRDNHPPILDEQTFFRAFNYLSAVTLEGLPNPDYNPYQQNARPTLEEHRPVQRPLFSGMLFTELDGKVRRAATNYTSKTAQYAYAVYNPYPIESIVWWKRAEYVDVALSQLLLDKLDATFNAEEWQQRLDEFRSEFERDRRFKQKQLDVLQQTMDNLLISLETLTHPEMVKRVQARYSEAEKERKRLSDDVYSATAEMARLEALSSLREMCSPALSSWDDLPREDKIVVIQSFIERVMVIPLEGQAITLQVQWRDGTSDEVSLARQGTTYTQCSRA